MSDVLDQADAVEMIRASAAGIADRKNLGRVRALRYRLPGIDRDVWRSMCELGWSALRVAEDQGGVGLGMTACCGLAEEIGAALVPEPLIGAMICARLLEGDPLADLLAGDRLILPAWQETRNTLGVGPETYSSGGRLSGTKRYIPMAAAADAFIIVTTDGLALVERDAPGLALETIETQDGGHYGVLHLDGVAANIFAGDVSLALEEATLATAAYLLGVADAAMVMTLDYLRTRVQFDRPIGSFQALQHRAVDLSLEIALTRAGIADAARRWDANPGSDDARATVSRAKARASATAMLVTRQSIQLHGGIGYTDEHDIGLYLRKAMTVAPTFGNAAFHRARFAVLLSDQPEQA